MVTGINGVNSAARENSDNAAYNQGYDRIFSKKPTLEIRMDDVLQTKLFTPHQVYALNEKTMFEWFLEADKVFEKYQYPCILAILEEGIDREPQWVEHIKKNSHRYIIELHGREHIRYGTLTKEELEEDLFWAKKRIEAEFGAKITTWYVPFGRKGRNPYAEEVCEKLGIKLGIPERKVDAKLWFRNRGMPHVNFHFWHRGQIGHVNEIVETLCR